MTKTEILQAVSFPVAMRDVFFDNSGKDQRDYEPIPNRKAVVRTDTHQALSIVSNDYKLLPYREMTEPVLEILDKNNAVLPQRTSGIRRDPIRVEAMGRRIWLETTFKGHEVKIGKDVIQPRLVYGNSYDGTLAYRAITGFYQVICTNAGALLKSGLVPGMGQMNISRKHKGRGENLPFNHLEDHLKMFLDNFGLMSQSLASLANTTVPLEKAKEIYMQYVGQRQSDKKPLEPKDQESAWSFYARITNYLTLDFRGGQAIFEKRAEQALVDIIQEAK